MTTIKDIKTRTPRQVSKAEDKQKQEASDNNPPRRLLNGLPYLHSFRPALLCHLARLALHGFACWTRCQRREPQHSAAQPKSGRGQPHSKTLATVRQHSCFSGSVSPEHYSFARSWSAAQSRSWEDSSSPNYSAFGLRLGHDRWLGNVAGSAEEDFFEADIARAFEEFLRDLLDRAVRDFLAAFQDENVGTDFLDKVQQV